LEQWECTVVWHSHTSIHQCLFSACYHGTRIKQFFILNTNGKIYIFFRHKESLIFVQGSCSHLKIYLSNLSYNVVHNHKECLVTYRRILVSVIMVHTFLGQHFISFHWWFSETSANNRMTLLVPWLAAHSKDPKNKYSEFSTLCSCEHLCYGSTHSYLTSTILL
jgi:hypothetical protein